MKNTFVQVPFKNKLTRILPTLGPGNSVSLSVCARGMGYFWRFPQKEERRFPRPSTLFCPLIVGHWRYRFCYFFFIIVALCVIWCMTTGSRSFPATFRSPIAATLGHVKFWAVLQVGGITVEKCQVIQSVVFDDRIFTAS